jgi:hypothetical protein
VLQHFCKTVAVLPSGQMLGIAVAASLPCNSAATASMFPLSASPSQCHKLVLLLQELPNLLVVAVEAYLLLDPLQNYRCIVY